MRRITFLICALLVIVCNSCPEGNLQSDNKDGTNISEIESPENEIPADGSEASEQILPFHMTIDGIEIDPDRRVYVAEGQDVTIAYQADFAEDCELMVVAPDDPQSYSIGSWNGTSANFSYSFEYGENKLLLRYGNFIYEIDVIAMVSDENQYSGAGCSSGIYGLYPHSKWRYLETADGAYPLDWYYEITYWTETDEQIFLTQSMVAMTGIEQAEVRNITLNLECRGGDIYILSAIEHENEAEKTTRYDENTLFIRSNLSPGDKWTRHGVMDVTMDGNVYSVNLVEEMECTGEEMISVQAGEYNAYRVQYRITGTGEEIDYQTSGTSWYAPGIGRILTLIDAENEPRRELVSYTPGTI